MFKKISGCPMIERFPVATSQLYNNGGLVYANGTGAVIPADATSGDHIGVAIEKNCCNRPSLY